MISRRSFLLGAGTLGLAGGLTSSPSSWQQAAAAGNAARLDRSFARIESQIGGRLGVAVREPGLGLTAGLNGDERFPMCSTFKLLAVSAVLRRVDEGKETLSREIAVPRDVILSYAPVAKKHAGGVMSLSALCAAAMVWSDNTAANLILTSLGGPAAATGFVRSLGDTVTRIDRMEPDANVFGPGEVRDTTTPNAILGDLDHLFLGDALSPRSRKQLTRWFLTNETGQTRLRAGLPKSWQVGDRTGTGPNGTSNDIAVAWRDDATPVLIAAYLTGSKADGDARNAALADVGRAVASFH